MKFLQAFSFKSKQINASIDLQYPPQGFYSPQNISFHVSYADIFFVISVFIA